MKQLVDLARSHGIVAKPAGRNAVLFEPGAALGVHTPERQALVLTLFERVLHQALARPRNGFGLAGDSPVNVFIGGPVRPEAATLRELGITPELARSHSRFRTFRTPRVLVDFGAANKHAYDLFAQKLREAQILELALDKTTPTPNRVRVTRRPFRRAPD